MVRMTLPSHAIGRKTAVLFIRTVGVCVCLCLCELLVYVYLYVSYVIIVPMV